MKLANLLSLLILFPAVLTFSACAGLNSTPRPLINLGNVDPGSAVMQNGEIQPLIGTPIKIGDHLPSISLVAADNLAEIDLANVRGKVLFLSIVPSIDTKVCEIQSHYLGEEGDRLPATVERITISRDTPFAQRRFAREAKLTDITFLSDYKEGAFGRSLGLLQKNSRLLARAVILVDGNGIVRYIQVVPELTNLPDMERAFDTAVNLAAEMTGG
jgi:thiol peroxidase